MSKSLRIGAVLAAVGMVVISVAAVSIYFASQRVPAFYRAAVELDAGSQREACDQFVAEVTALASNLHGKGRWQRLFTADQINAWLALELATEYPDLLSAQLRDPRIAIEEHEATIACRYDDGAVSAIVSLTVDAYLHEPNVLALRIRRARAGALPVPLARVLDGISRVAAELKLRLEWRKTHGDPVALITLSRSSESDSAGFELETLDLRGGEIFLAGRIGTRDHVVKSDAAHESPDATSEASSPEDADQPAAETAAKETRQE